MPGVVNVVYRGPSPQGHPSEQRKVRLTDKGAQPYDDATAIKVQQALQKTLQDMQVGMPAPGPGGSPFSGTAEVEFFTVDASKSPPVVKVQS